MEVEVADVLYLPLGDHAMRVASEAVQDLIDDPARDMETCFLGSLLIAHRGGGDHVATARAVELAGTCVDAVHRAVFAVRAQTRGPVRLRLVDP